MKARNNKPGLGKAKAKRKPKWLVRYYAHGWWDKPREKQTEFTQRYFASRDEALGFAARAVLENRTAGTQVVDTTTLTRAFSVSAGFSKTFVYTHVKPRKPVPKEWPADA